MFQSYIRRNKVRKFREAILMSIAELARRSGLTYQTVTKMKRGLPTRKHSELKAAKTLNKNMKTLFAGAIEYLLWVFN